MNFGKTITVGALVGFAALCLISIDLANAEKKYMTVQSLPNKEIRSPDRLSG